MRDVQKHYSSGAWRNVRRHILERDQRVCQIAAPGCTGVATEVDHIVPVLDGGQFYDPDNLRASCRGCNSRRAKRRTKKPQGWRAAPTHIVLVAGPPAAGKSTYVAEHAAPEDVVVDYDRMAQALGSPDTHDHRNHDAVMAARGAVLSRLRRGQLKARRAWIVSANPKAQMAFPHHELVVIDPGVDEVKRRARDSGRPESWFELIDRWYERRDPSPVGPSREW